MSTRAFIDWLECTLPGTWNSITAATDAYSDVLECTRGRWTYSKPFDGYKHAVRTPEGLVVLVGREDMGAHLVAPGEAMTYLASHNVNVTDVVGAIIQQNGLFSRIDCAIDVTDERLNIHDLQKRFVDGEADTRAVANNLMGDGKQAVTWYLGSWKSDHFMRTYNKWSELAKSADVPETRDWIRIELVNRDKYARLAGDLIYSTGSVPTAVRTLIMAYIDFPHVRAWVRALRGDSVEVGPSVRTVKSTRKWLEGPVAMSLARELVGEPAYLDTWQRALDSAMDAVRRQQLDNAHGDYPT